MYILIYKNACEYIHIIKLVMHVICVYLKNVIDPNLRYKTVKRFNHIKN